MALNHSANSSVPQTRPRVWASFGLFERFAGISIPQSRIRHPKLNPNKNLAHGGPVRHTSEDGWCYPAVGEIGLSPAERARHAA